MKMKSVVVSSLIAAAGAVALIGMAPSLSSPAVAAPAAGGFTVDPVHSSVVFRIKHMDTSYFYGRFNGPTGTFDINWESPESSTIDVSVKTDDVDTNNAGRDKHLKSEDFFSAKEFPTIAFKGKTFKKGAHGVEVTGELTLHGQTKPATCTIEHSGSGKGRGGEALEGIETTLVIKRTDFGMSKMVGAAGVGDEVTLRIALEGGKK